MIVRDLQSNTVHAVYKRMERGLIRTIKPKHYHKSLFEIVPQGPEDMDVKRTDKKGRELLPEVIEAAQAKAYDAWHKKNFDRIKEENKLAIARLDKRRI